MKAASFYAIAAALSAADVRFIVVGGLAVIEHGYLRATRDVDIVIQLVAENVLSCFKALEEIGYHPTVPISAEQFADPDLRQRWQEEKHMRVLQFWSDDYPDTKLDVFLDSPFDFDLEWKHSKRVSAQPHATEIRFASIPALIKMKRVAGRPRDLIDIEYLKKLLEDSS
jgi:hypothetical protein